MQSRKPGVLKHYILFACIRSGHNIDQCFNSVVKLSRSKMDISRANSRLSVIVFIIIAFSLNTSSQHLYSEEESEETANKCTVYATDFERSSMETDQEEFNSKGIVRIPLHCFLTYTSIKLIMPQ